MRQLLVRFIYLPFYFSNPDGYFKYFKRKFIVAVDMLQKL